MKKLLKRILALLRQIFQQFSSTEQPSSPPSYHPPAIPIPPIPTFVPQWHNGLVLVCSQCTVEQFDGSSHRINKSTTASSELQNWLKSRLKFDGLWGKYRVVSTSCLGVCPQGGVVVVLRHDAVGQQCFIVRPQGEREILYSYIKQMHKY
ncbi:(2Fe-2S) ferredoxin domain-containing protein [Nostoc parmelioides]|uniref:(2Fe-2S) ferredoxin domain-containing protein n=1 Tax=Nostoc parmelioides FACHB-3921 TaxID=2692909 RepID=A0ABR8BKS3_9NOSO|nr:(2Fe-2S) ferredoxin domain-containing protein [Nostoc parmelioides]MBD2254274.1 (2Fe-2S) ferredoxin domain-containing protein [Nostoc parmelioides FACHB-3921]